MTETVKLARDFLQRVGDMLEEKNARYGDSAARPLRIFSRANRDEQIRVRIDDKLSRLARGTGVETEDTVMDLVGYLALLVAIRESLPDD